MKKLFGTDGIRGLANKYPVTPALAMKTGMAAAMFVKSSGYRSIVIGKDTRISGDMLESALAAGITSAGVDALICGVIPTPGIAFLSSDLEGAGAGIVISASHNPWQDNGIKIFKRGGHKLSDEEEEGIEADIFSLELDSHDLSNSLINLDSDKEDFQGRCTDSRKTFFPQGQTGRLVQVSDALEKYVLFLKKGFSPFIHEKNSLKRNWRKTHFKLIVDCSNGAASQAAPKLFNHSMFDAGFIFNEPNGTNINDSCGSQHTEELAKRVVNEGADMGIALDGDADRLIALDENGEKITGDRILAICAKHAKEEGSLDNNLVVSTVMSNIGLSKLLHSLEIGHLITDVGDREVLKKMAESGAVMGGEDSGHMIFSRYHTTGDGLLTALRLLYVMVDTGKPLSELASIMKVYPQVLMNVTVDDSRPEFMAIPEIADEIRAVEKALNNNGRVLVRYSGTQPLLRVMVEGPDSHTTNEYCRRICDAIREKMNPDSQ